MPPTPLATSADAHVHQSGPAETPTWTIVTAKTRLLLRWSPDRGLVLDRLAANSIVVPGDGATPIFDITLGYPDLITPQPPRLIAADAVSQTFPGAEPSVTLTVQIAFGNDRVAVHVRAYPGQAMIEQWLSITAAGPATLDTIVPLNLGLTLDGTPTLATVAGLQGQGHYRGDSGPYRSFRLEHHPLGAAPVHRASGRRSTWDATPWFAVLNDADATGKTAAGGIVGGLEYSGTWALDASHTLTDNHTAVAIGPRRLRPRLQPGEPWSSPVAFFGIFAGDLDAAVAVQHDFVRGVLSPPLPVDFPWVQYNTWFSHYCDLDAASLAEEAANAAALGADIFYVDAGWWAANPRPIPGGIADDFSTGLGHWVENRDKFPDGIRAFADTVRSHGMHFGIWVEPERVDLRTASTGGWMTKWLAATGGRFVRTEWTPDTDAGWLCFGHPDAQAWAISWISDLVENLGVRWLKWDSNWWEICDAPGHGHGPEDGESAQLAGVHAVFAALRVRFPDLVLENCAGGGTRMDFGFARSAHVHWVHDGSDPGHRASFHVHGASHLLPPATLNAWLVESRYENLQGTHHPDPVIRAMIRSRMANAFGLSCRTTGWTDHTRRICTEEIAAFKDYRHLILDGYVSWPLPQTALESPQLIAPQSWESVQFTAADASEAVVLAFRNLSMLESVTITLKNLDPASTYSVTDEFGLSADYAGAALMTGGLPMEILPLTSARYRLRRLDPGTHP